MPLLAKKFTIPMLQDLLYDEFESNSSPGKEILRENGIVIQFLKAYLKIAGKEYLGILFKDIVHQICVTERKISYEIDPNKVDAGEIATNIEAFTSRLNYIIQVMTDPAMIDAMPLGIRVLCQITARLSRQFRPSHEKIYVGSLLLLRYINPALFTPEGCGLLPAGKSPPPVSRRNLILITKVLQNISNGVSFSKKEAFMSTLCLDGWKDQIYDYFDRLVNFTFDPDSLSDDRVKIEASSLHVIHSVVFDLRAELSDMIRQVEGEEGLKDFNQLLERLGSYTSRESFSYLEAAHQALIKTYLDTKQSEAYYIGYANVDNQGKGIILIGSYRVVTMNLSCKPLEELHHLSLQEISSASPQQVQLKYSTGASISLKFDDNTADSVISCIIRAYEHHFAGIHKNFRFQLKVSPAERLEHFSLLSESYESDSQKQPCSGLVSTYRALCNLYAIKPSDALCWDLANLFTGASDINFEKFTDYYEEPLTDVTVNPLCHALGINTQFSQVTIKNMKFTNDANFRGLAEMMKHTSSIKSLTLNAITGMTAGATRMVFGTLQANIGNNLTKLSLPLTQISDSAAAQSLGDYFASRSVSLHELILTGCLQKGCILPVLDGLSNPACVKNLRKFHMGRTKLSDVSHSFCSFLSLCTNLTDLDVSLTDIPLPELVKSMNGKLLKLNRIILHGNKLPKPQNWEGFVEFLSNTQHNIRDVNISGTNIPPATLAEILSIKEGSFAIEASCNNLGKSGALKICEAIPRIKAVDTLGLADNAMTDVGLVAVIEALCNCSAVARIDLSDNFENNNDLIIAKLAVLVQSICPLEAIIVNSTGNHGKFKDLNKFLYAIGNNNNITELHISGHGVGDRGAIALARVLQQNLSLTAVHFDGNNIGELGLRNVADAVPRAKSLREMPMPFADIARIMVGMEPSQARNFSKQLADIERELSSRRFRDNNAGL
eukprot:TRINITY_DN3557_c0_g1_i2.p1 TRINITY_DN3557_c0_g1~~TRINITY_DN3557_c0_g1_i2.p1  ORF type:complete len:948 (+),score=149.59 TRINITY_DN3557_c0_g1_i2:198-3041(+)